MYLVVYTLFVTNTNSSSPPPPWFMQLMNGLFMEYNIEIFSRAKC